MRCAYDDTVARDPFHDFWCNWTVMSGKRLLWACFLPDLCTDGSQQRWVDALEVRRR